MYQNKYFKYLAILLLLGTWSAALMGQATECDLQADVTIRNGGMFMNYGNQVNSRGPLNRMSITIGQPLSGNLLSQDNIADFGYWSNFLLPAKSPVVLASEGEFLDRIRLDWELDGLSPPATQGYKIFRDGSFLTRVDAGVEQFLDFNVRAGKFYQYEIKAVNDFGDGLPGEAVGFVNPNGVVTGEVTTESGNPVVDVAVTLSPVTGKAMRFDGVDDYLCVAHKPVLDNLTDFTVFTWVKIGEQDSDGIIDFGSAYQKNWWLHTTTNAGSKGVKAAIGTGSGEAAAIYEFPEDGKDDWHHVAMVYKGSKLLLYIDGMLEGMASGTMSSVPSLISIGKQINDTGFFDGSVDDIRIYNRAFTQTEIIQGKDLTASSQTPNLVAYWKFDEGIGKNAFDLSPNELDASISGASFSDDKPEVLNTGMTNEHGVYIIEGIDYSDASTFTVRPMKSFYRNQALELNANDQSYATLTDIDLMDSASIEVVFQAFEVQSKQTILSKNNGSEEVFQLYIENGTLNLTIAGTNHEFGTIDRSYQHIVMTLDQVGSTLKLKLYNKGELVGSEVVFSNVPKDWTGYPWMIGAAGGSNPTGFLTGLIDEVALYNQMRQQTEIQLSERKGIDGTDTLLLSYYTFSEGVGTTLSDVGLSALQDTGKIYQSTWSIVTKIPLEVPHEFLPNERIVNLTESSTGIGSINFTDLSTINVTGKVRFENTFCFQDSVEILVNGLSHTPPIYTNKQGVFSAEFEPGIDVKLIPRNQEEHVFFPGFFERRNLVNPLSGVVFFNLTKRSLEGAVVGGECRFPVIDHTVNERVIMELRANNGCFVRQDTITLGDGKYKFDNIPPIDYTIGIAAGSKTTLFNFFEIKGGVPLSLKAIEKDTVDFTYFTRPEVELSSFPNETCAGGEVKSIINTDQRVTQTIKIYQPYLDKKCLLDSAKLSITNNIADLNRFDTLMSEGELKYTYVAGRPSFISPFEKQITISANANGLTGDIAEKVVVLGGKSLPGAIRTNPIDMPLYILRDPPGDGSFAFLETNKKVCRALDVSSTYTNELGAHIGASFSNDFIVTNSSQKVTLDLHNNYSKEEGRSTEMCLTFNERISTSANPEIVGDNGDVYVGFGTNFLIGDAVDLIFNDTICQLVLDTTSKIGTEFSTFFALSQLQIESVLIPEAENGGNPEIATRWKELIARNDSLKMVAKEPALNIEVDTSNIPNFKEFVEQGEGNNNKDTDTDLAQKLTLSGIRKNITIDAGAVYSSFWSQDTVTGVSELESDDHTLGVDISGFIGPAASRFIFDVNTKFNWQNSEYESNTQQNTTTVGFTIKDDDPGDFVTFDVLTDTRYKTPVFKLRGGATSCPWQPKTQNRDEVAISIDKNFATNIGEHGRAVFKLTLGNLSQTEETRTYRVEPLAENNPEGAIIRIGQSTKAQNFAIKHGEPLEIVMTVEKGPVAFDYTDLRVAISADCEVFDRSNTINERFYKTVDFNVGFVEGCSAVDVAFPLQDWVINPSANGRQEVVIANYDTDHEDLEEIRMQYRLVGGSGIWINFDTIPKIDLGPVNTTSIWNIDNLSDASYEVRAVTICKGGLPAGSSDFIQGIIERRSPQVLGTPQPADGVLSSGDEISITFDENITCTGIQTAENNAGLISNNNIGLYDIARDELVNFTFSCLDNKIVIVPTDQNSLLENRRFRVVVDSLQDLAGNYSVKDAGDNFIGPTVWEYLVDRNSLRWEGLPINESKIEGDLLTVTRVIANNGGNGMDYSIENIPDWMVVEPNKGFINPGTLAEITFTFPRYLLIGNYSQTLMLKGTEGEETLQVDLSVRCTPPDWIFTNEAKFPETHSFTFEVDIEDKQSQDAADMVAAFIDGELRGAANIEYIRALNKYMAFVTVHGDTEDGNDGGKPINFQVFDGSQCKLYSSIIEPFDFQPKGIEGLPLTPTVIHTTNLIERKIPISAGWNWISFNLDLGNNSVTNTLRSLKNVVPNNQIKDQNSFAGFLDIPGREGWYGMEDISYHSKYLYFSTSQDTICLNGTAYDPENSPIPIKEGWNWIGYVPQLGTTVTKGLASLTPLNGDLIKSQTEFAQYVAGDGWIGNLQVLNAPNGYLLYTKNSGTLIYPDAQPGEDIVGGGRSNKRPYYQVNTTDYPKTMNIVGRMQEDASLQFDDLDEIGVFDESGTLKGRGDVVYIPTSEEYLMFITMYEEASKSEGKLTFKLYKKAYGRAYPLTETIQFEENLRLGTVTEPVLFSLPAAEVVLANQSTSFEVFPNPASQHIYLQFQTLETSNISIAITDAIGRQLEIIETELPKGMATIERNVQHLENGIYLIRVRHQTGEEFVRKIVISKK